MQFLGKYLFIYLFLRVRDENEPWNSSQRGVVICDKKIKVFSHNHVELSVMLFILFCNVIIIEQKMLS